MPRKKRIQLPTQGDAFVVPLDDGHYSVCRVILDASSDAAKRWKSDCVLVACSEWIGGGIPKADDPALRPILCLTHHSWSGKRELLWISDPVPDGFIPLGRIQPTPDEIAVECGTFGGWSSMAIQPLLQWRWNNDRAAVLQEDKETNAKEIERRKKVESQRHAYIELGESASEDDRMAILQSSIQSFNELDAKLKFIETIEREDICEEFEAIVHACGLGRHENLADEWRDW